MQATLVEQNGVSVVHVTGTPRPIQTRDSVLSIIMGSSYRDAVGFVIEAKCFHPDFFRLKTGLAGELLQLFVNYRCNVAIIGDFSAYPGDSLRDFIRESNRGRHVFFLPSLEEAVQRLGEVAPRA